MRGEQERDERRRAADRGSSPHARGAGRQAMNRARVGRIIPACAGSSWRCCTSGGCRRDHPRMRGEQGLELDTEWVYSGSSPHARGAGRRRLRAMQFTGIIPACAGSSRRRASERICKGDHPRMRGEQAKGEDLRGVAEGSSPHARGADLRANIAALPPGIIPACAGSRKHLTWCGKLALDHPRMRGEQSVP